MIKTKKDLIHYLERDRAALCVGTKKPRFLVDHVWKFEIALRKCEYFTNKNKKIRSKFYKFLCYRRGLKIGFSTIPINVFGAGLRIAHPFDIAVSQNAKIGENCIIFQGVTIGSNMTNISDAAVIGNNVVICAGAKIIGDVVIADNVVIGANAVVTKDILEKGTTWAGVPAKKISNSSSIGFYLRQFKK